MRMIKDEFSIETFFEHSNPFVEKFYELTRNADESVARELRPNQEEKM